MEATKAMCRHSWAPGLQGDDCETTVLQSADLGSRCTRPRAASKVLLARRRPFPNATWTAAHHLGSPALAAATLGVVVTISARSRTYAGALKAGGLLALPLIAVLIAQATKLVFLGPWSVAAAGALL